MPIDFNDYYFEHAVKSADGEMQLDTDAISKRLPGAHIFHYSPERWMDGIREDSYWTNLESDVPFHVNEATGMGEARIKWRARWIFPYEDAERLLKNMQPPFRNLMSWEYNNIMHVPDDQLEWVQIG